MEFFDIFFSHFPHVQWAGIIAMVLSEGVEPVPNFVPAPPFIHGGKGRKNGGSDADCDHESGRDAMEWQRV
jgi:hypothetical protein